MNRKKLNKCVGAELKAIRKTQGLTQEKIAKRLKMSRPNWVNIEGGRTNVSICQLFQIADLLDLDTNSIVRGIKRRYSKKTL